MTLRQEIGLALRVATMPIMGMLAVVSAVRDTAIAARVKDDEAAADLAVAWDRLEPENLAFVLDWKYGR